MITNVLLTAILTSIIALIVGLIYAGIRISNVYRQFYSFITPEAEGKPSHLANLAQALSEVFARSVTAQIKTSLMGISSGIVRGEKAEERQAAEAVIASHPLGGLVNILPNNIKRSLMKNPGIIDLVMKNLTKNSSQLPMVISPGDNGKNEVNFKL